MISKYTYKHLTWVDLESPTKQEIRSVLNHERNTIKTLLNDGRIEHDEADKMLINVEERVFEKGTLEVSPQFGEQALQELYRFFRSYDLALLQQARRIAIDKKLSSIDKASMTASFRASAVANKP